MTIDPDEKATVVTVKDDDDCREIVIRAYKLKDVQSKEKIAALERESITKYEEMDDERRRALNTLVTDAFIRLIEDPDIWLPTSLVAESDTRFDIYIGIHLADIDQEVVRKRIENDEDLHAKRTDLQGIKQELATGPVPGAGPA